MFIQPITDEKAGLTCVTAPPCCFASLTMAPMNQGWVKLLKMRLGRLCLTH